jgi:DNA polymerase/3'-5' exonuclease PolX
MSTFNNEIIKNLHEIAALLKAQHANHFRCQAYLKAADTIENSTIDLSVLFEEQGIQGLINLPTIGEGIAHLIEEFITTGRMSQLENLQGASDPVGLLQLIPTVGKGLAERLHDKLNIDTFASL